MKLRTAAVVAGLAVVGAMVAYRWDFSGGPASDSPPSETEAPRKAAPVDVPDSPRAEVPAMPAPMSAPVPASVPAPDKPVATVAASAPAAVPRKTLPAPTPDPRSGRPVATAPPVPAAVELPPTPPDPEGMAKAAVDVDKVGLMLRDYRTRFGENPTGTNAEILKSVMGGNPKQAQLGPPEGQNLNGLGELVDRWGTPYFFHQMSKTDMEIRSAGPDRRLWTEDDLVGH